MGPLLVVEGQISPNSLSGLSHDWCRGRLFGPPSNRPQARMKRTTGEWDRTYWEGKQLLTNLLNIEVPIIAAINGPALRHSELPLLSDIVLAAEEATVGRVGLRSSTIFKEVRRPLSQGLLPGMDLARVDFQDSAHFNNGLTPGDGMHIIYPLLLGMNRGRYFLLTGQTIEAQQALELGLVSEVLPRAQLLPRAWELAEQLAQRPTLVVRYSRVLLTHALKGLMHDLLGYGLALEGLGAADDSAATN